MYKIFVNGKRTELETVAVSAHPFNRVWPGKQREPSQSETAYMLRVFGEGELTLEIETDAPVSSAVVRPLSKKVPISFSSHKVSISVPRNGKYAIEINGRRYAIHLLYQRPVDDTAFPSPTYDFGEGHHHVGLLRLKSGDTVRIARNAVVHGSLLAVDAHDVTVYGEGVLCGDWEKRTERHGDLGFDDENLFDPTRIHTYGGIRAYRCKNVSLRGVTVTDTASYAISFFATEGIEIDDVNVLGLWKYNCDGIDFFNSSNITVRDCFIRSFDDSMCMKGLTAFSDQNTENAQVSNCVFWCDWGKNIDIGLATAAKEIKNIVWQDCDIIHNSGICIAISNGQWADVHDISFQNIRVEYATDTETPVLQASDTQTYQTAGHPHLPRLISITDTRRAWQGNISYEDERTKIRNVTIDGLSVTMEKGIDKLPDISINKTTQSSVFENIVIKNVFVNGEEKDAGTQRGRDRNMIFENLGLCGGKLPRMNFSGHDGAYKSENVLISNFYFNGEPIIGEFAENKTDPYAQMAKNTVHAQGQLTRSNSIKFDFPDNNGIRVMFVGNSITLHGRRPQIGWHHEWGMAASAKELDYVHLLETNIKKLDPEAAFCICQVAEWERRYKEGSTILSRYAAARDFGADLIILRFVENVPKDGYESDTFLRELDALVNYLNQTGAAKLIITTGFWKHPGDNDIRRYAGQKGIPCVELGDLGENEQMKAIGLFEHNGVANHPGDKGMMEIASRITKAIAKEKDWLR